MTVSSDFERRITDAFNDRARSLPAGSGLPPMALVRDRRARRPTRVLVLALVTLLVIGAAGVFVVTRRSGGTSGSVESGGSGAARYRSTAIVRIAPESSAAADLRLTRPLKLALAPGIEKLARKKSRVGADDARVAFAASENAQRTVLTLVASAPSAALATSVARSWANALTAAARVNQRNVVLARLRAVDQQLARLNRQLATIDTDLARLLPAIYRNVLEYDEPTGPSPTDGGSSTSVKGPPPVPEQGTPHALNLAFERIQLLSARSKAEAKRVSLQFFPSASLIGVVSLTPATRVGGSK
jgi:hypothetical protein